MIIYANGDSFVAGVELGDDIFPGYPGKLSLPHDDSPDSNHFLAKQWILNTYNQSHELGKKRLKLLNEILSLEYSRAFPKKLSQILKYDTVPYFNRNFSEFKPPFVINRALGGSSMDRIVRTSIADLIEIRKHHTSKIIAIIGTTDISRSEIPSWSPHRENLQGDPGVWVCLHNHGTLPKTVPYIRDLINFKLAYQLDYHSLVNFYKNVVLLQDFCKLNNIVLMWVETYRNNLISDTNNNLYTDLQNFKDYAALEYSTSMNEIADEINHNVLCPSGHFSEIVHEAVAIKLANLIRNIMSTET
jgi:hypothetical protein